MAASHKSVTNSMIVVRSDFIRPSAHTTTSSFPAAIRDGLHTCLIDSKRLRSGGPRNHLKEVLFGHRSEGPPVISVAPDSDRLDKRDPGYAEDRQP